MDAFRDGCRPRRGATRRRQLTTEQAMTTTFHVDAAAPTTALPHFWERIVGSGHAPLGLRADWQAQLTQAHRELGFSHVRFHGILSDDMGTLIEQNERPLYSFHNADVVLDFLMSIGMRPFVELSFMPSALSSGGDTVFHYRANVTPPRDLDRWATLISKLVTHWVERYGAEEVRQWFFEVWNEPNLAAFWSGTREDYLALYRRTAEAVKTVDGALRVGGPASAANAWVADLVAFCERERVPLDFVSTHHYPTDAFGEPGDDTPTQLSDSHLGVLREESGEVRRQAGDRPLYYTEWSTSSNPRDTLHDEPYAAAYIVRAVMEQQGLVQGYGYWTFSDLFEENYFPSVPFHGGFGLMNIHGIAKPAWRAYELLHGLGEERLEVTGEHATLAAWAVRDEGGVTLLLVNLALPRHAIASEAVRVELAALPPFDAARLARIDGANANATAAWHALGAPEYPTPGQVERLRAASCLAWETLPCPREEGVTHVALELPPQSVAAIRLECAPAGRT